MAVELARTQNKWRARSELRKRVAGKFYVRRDRFGWWEVAANASMGHAYIGPKEVRRVRTVGRARVQSNRSLIVCFISALRRFCRRKHGTRRNV